MPDRHLSSDDVESVIVRVREELARRRISRQRLADEARISVSTLEKVLSGRRTFTLATLVRLEEALGVSLRPTRANGARRSNERPVIAPDELGSYARAQVAWLEGAFLTLIPSFGERSAISAFRIDIRWDEAQACLTFRESERVDGAFTQHGFVAMPSQTGHIYLVTNRHGQQRLAILSRPASQGTMHGLLATLISGRGSQLTPVAAPIALVPLDTASKTTFGRISQGQPDYARYRTLLRRTLDESFAVLMPV
ncbi:MAG: transcriptional regulator [Hyphomicrobium sp.]|jgi:transcriptional regulator with XRE-family HTH domain|nr:transcriptional regulator [Hyphomicrobium sp.]PPD09059.1 MAG: transcriptional regulator [Hyphomicrobium sp.]